MRDLAAEEWVSHPAPSCFALAANRLGWKLEEVLCLGLHATPYARLLPLLGRGVRVICTLRDGAAPAELAAWLAENGQPDARLCVMERLGGAKEQLQHAIAGEWDLPPGGAPVLMAIEAMRPPNDFPAAHNGRPAERDAAASMAARQVAMAAGGRSGNFRPASR